MIFSADAAPAISVVIPCRNEKDHIEGVIRSVLEQEQPQGGYELILADGMSDDGTREILERMAEREPRLRIIDNPGQIVSTGLNAAIRAARGTVILRMDAHTSYAPDYILQCVATLKETGVDNVGGPWVAEGKSVTARAVAAVFRSNFGTGGARGHDPHYTGPVDTVYLGCWPRSVFERFGMFDEELTRNQDDEFNLRLLRAGGRIWQSAKIQSRYAVRGSLPDLFRQYTQYGYWKVRVIQKHKMPASWRHLVPSAFVFVFLVLSLAAPWWSVAIWMWLVLSGVYAICNILASILTAARHDWKLLSILPFVFACYHFAYGYGFLRGILDFIILRRRPSLYFTRLTRSATKSY
jgi:glycosyltransferase involved in cell wall biosynthesis